MVQRWSTKIEFYDWNYEEFVIIIVYESEEQEWLKTWVRIMKPDGQWNKLLREFMQEKEVKLFL